MSTLIEIEAVVGRLPLAEQKELLRRLETTLRRPQSAGTSIPREDWMRRLSSLRASIGSGMTKLSSEQILEDLRED